MKYFFLESEEITSVIVAKSIESACKIANDAGVEFDYIYELTPETFEHEGFLLCDFANLEQCVDCKEESCESCIFDHEKELKKLN